MVTALPRLQHPLPRSLVLSLYIFLSILAFFSVLAFVFLVYYYDGLVDSSKNIFKKNPTNNTSTAANANVHFSQTITSACEYYMYYEFVNTNQSDLTTFDFGDITFTWGKRKPELLLENSKEFGLFIFNSSESTTCRLVYESDSYGPVIVAGRDSNPPLPQQSPLPTDSLLLFLVQKSNFALDSQFPVLLGRTKIPDLESKELVEWAFWNGDTFGDVSDTIPVFSVYGRDWKLSVIWSFGAYVAAYSNKNEIVVQVAFDEWGTRFTNLQKIELEQNARIASLQILPRSPNDARNVVYLIYQTTPNNELTSLKLEIKMPL